MNIFIILFILLINVINIFAIYKLLGKDIKNKEKIIFIAVGVAIMYMLVSVVYWLSSIGMDKNAADGLAAYLEPENNGAGTNYSNINMQQMQEEIL